MVRGLVIQNVTDDRITPQSIASSLQNQSTLLLDRLQIDHPEEFFCVSDIQISDASIPAVPKVAMPIPFEFESTGMPAFQTIPYVHLHSTKTTSYVYCLAMSAFAIVAMATALSYDLQRQRRQRHDGRRETSISLA